MRGTLLLRSGELIHRRSNEMVKKKKCRELKLARPDPARDRLPPSATQNSGFSERGH